MPVLATKPPVVVRNNDPLIHFHGRWDASPGTWWTGSGFKLAVENLSSLTLNLGPHTTSPLASLGVSVNFEPFRTVNVSQGRNEISLSASTSEATSQHKSEFSVVRINVEGWQNNRMNLETIELNAGAKLIPYRPQSLAFQFIGDSLTAGQFVPLGVDQAWPFLTAEGLKAEHNVNAQPGAALTDIVSFGNEHGVSFQFFRTEDTGYFDTTDHNFTTPWNFRRDQPQATHIVIHIGANDASQNVTAEAFTNVFLSFLGRLRTIYPHQPIMVFTPWGWPNADGSINQYYPGVHASIVEKQKERGDRNIFLVNTTNWVTWADVFPDNQHPNVEGHQKIAGLFTSWLEKFGVTGETVWEAASRE